MTERPKAPRASGRGVRHAGITSGITDTESGNEDPGLDRDLYALKSLYERGLIPQDIYEARRAELLGECAGRREGLSTS